MIKMPLFDRLFGKKEKEKKPIEQRPERREPLRFRKGDKIQNRYEVKAVLGGGMGVVYIALDHDWDQLFAIKTFQDKFLWNEEIINRFMEEAETWVNLERHTNIVFANFVQKIEGKPFIFLEYIDGGDQSQFIGRMDISQALDFAIQFCTGMDYAYNKLGVIHRDIKPGNVMVARDDRFRFGYAFKVTDFGLVKALGKAYVEGLLESPSVSTGMGTWPYMPPEQFPEKIQAKFSFKPKPITTRTDVYSFGVTFYEVLSGRLPFADVGEIFSKNPVNPMSINSRIPEGLDWLIMKCLEKNLEDRYSDFEEIREDLIAIYNKVTGEEYIVKGGKKDLTAIDWNNKGLALHNLERYKEAIECCDKALKINPKLEAAWLNKGNALISLGRNEEAIECCDKALEIDPKLEAAWSNKGIALVNNLGRNEEAIECCDRALEINPRLAEAWYNRGVALNDLGRHKEAIECCNKALEINPRYAEAWSNKGAVLVNFGKYDEAIECYDKALKINPKYVEAWSGKGAALVSTGRYDEVIKCCDRALEMNPIYAEAWSNKGAALVSTGRYDEAIECYDNALEINPRYTEAWYNKGVVLGILSRYEEALKCFDKTLGINPKLESAIKFKEYILTRISGK